MREAGRLFAVVLAWALAGCSFSIRWQVAGSWVTRVWSMCGGDAGQACHKAWDLMWETKTPDPGLRELEQRASGGSGEAGAWLYYDLAVLYQVKGDLAAAWHSIELGVALAPLPVLVSEAEAIQRDPRAPEPVKQAKLRIPEPAKEGGPDATGGADDSKLSTDCKSPPKQWDGKSPFECCNQGSYSFADLDVDLPGVVALKVGGQCTVSLSKSKIEARVAVLVRDQGRVVVADEVELTGSQSALVGVGQGGFQGKRAVISAPRAVLLDGQAHVELDSADVSGGTSAVVGGGQARFRIKSGFLTADGFAIDLGGQASVTVAETIRVHGGLRLATQARVVGLGGGFEPVGPIVSTSQIDLVITNGTFAGADGSGLELQGGDITLKGCTVSGATGIHLSGGDLTLDGSTVRGTELGVLADGGSHSVILKAGASVEAPTGLRILHGDAKVEAAVRATALGIYHAGDRLTLRKDAAVTAPVGVELRAGRMSASDGAVIEASDTGVSSTPERNAEIEVEKGARISGAQHGVVLHGHSRLVVRESGTVMGGVVGDKGSEISVRKGGTVSGAVVANGARVSDN